MTKLALYFGCIDCGHFLYGPSGRTVSRNVEGEDLSLPWKPCLMDTGLLNNRKVPDVPDGRVHWTCGGRPALWFAFFWWDRSGDERGNSNSGFYVRGFDGTDVAAAFEFAKAEWPHVVARQRFPLVLHDPPRSAQ